jgi:hypothetical protein
MVLLSMRLGVQPFGSAAWHYATLDEMMQNFERQRDKEFASHVCAEYQPRAEGKEPGVPKRTQSSPET